MGNRAIIIITDKEEKAFSPAIYLHWNGGPDSVYAFLKEMDYRNIRRNQPDCEVARLIQIIGEFFDEDEYSSTSLSVLNTEIKSMTQVDVLAKLDPGDNGVYVVCRRPVLTVRRFNKGVERTAEQVQEEREKAEKSPYWTSERPIQDTWRRLHPERRVGR